MATHARYEKCFILCGPGANGKSVLGAIAKEMVGRKYTASVQPAKMDSVFQRSHLEGKLLNLVTELNQNEELKVPGIAYVGYDEQDKHLSKLWRREGTQEKKAVF